jgi:hypothetical protein
MNAGLALVRVEDGRVVLEPVTPESLAGELAGPVADRLAIPDPWLGVESAAAHMGCKAKRIYNLKSEGSLPPDGFDGNRPRWRRSTLDAYLAAGGDRAA